MTDDAMRETHDEEPQVEVAVVEIESDIDETRSEMGETLSEIGERLDPARLTDEAKQKVRDATVGRVEEAVESAGNTARGVTDMVMETIRRNPIPAAIAGVGLALLWANRSEPNSHRRSSNGSSDGSLIDSAKQGAAGVGDKVATTAGEAVDNVQQLAQDATDTARQNVGELGSQAQRIMYDSPMVAGIAAFGAGAAVGLLVPGTPLERELMTEPTAALAEAAADAADQLGTKAEQSIDEVGTPEVATV